MSFSHVTFDGQNEDQGANLQIQGAATDVSVTDSAFTICGSGARAFSRTAPVSPSCATRSTK